MVDSQVNKRFIVVIEYLGFSRNGKLAKSAFAQYIGVHPSTIGEITLNRKGVGSVVLTGLSERNPEINIAWILRGEGSMITGEIKPKSERKHDKVIFSEKCQECERNKGRIEILRETIAELKKEKSELIHLLSQNKAKE